MGKLPTIAWTVTMLASLGLAGCKCCHSCKSSHSCSNGSCSAPVGSTTHHTASPVQPEGLPTMMPPVSGQPVSVMPGKSSVSTYRSMPHSTPAATPASNTWRVPPMGATSGKPMPTGPIHHVGAMEQDDSDMDSAGPPAPLPPPSSTTGSIPTITDTMLPPGTPVPARPPISH